MRAAVGREFKKPPNIEEVPIPTPGSGGEISRPYRIGGFTLVGARFAHPGRQEYEYE